MRELILIDACMLLGALVQLLLVLRARNFYLKDWLVPVAFLLGGSIGWFLFIRLCSGSQDFHPAAEAFCIGFGMALTGTAVFVSAFAPLQLNSATLLSLTISFWAVYFAGGAEHKWLWAAVPMTLAALVFVAGRGRDLLPFRVALQLWALSAACLVAYDAIPSSIAKIVGDYRAEELAQGFQPLDALVTGAQVFLLAQMGVGLILLLFPDTWNAWLPGKEKDESLPKPAVVALIVQTAIFIWLRKSGGQAQSQFMAVSVFAALAHGAMTGPDARASRPVVDFEISDRR